MSRFFCSNTNVNPSGFPKFNPSFISENRDQYAVSPSPRGIKSVW
ncbi:unnamed protein product, partial [Brassica oleracea]